MARALLAAQAMIDDGALSAPLDERYAGWGSGVGADILGGSVSLADLHTRQLTGSEPEPVSGRQEMLENIVARYVERAR